MNGPEHCNAFTRPLPWPRIATVRLTVLRSNQSCRCPSISAASTNSRRTSWPSTAASIPPACPATSPSSWTATAAGPASARLKRFLGHQQGAESVQYVVETASRIDLPWLTLYAFSLENNLRRPKAEVSFLMSSSRPTSSATSSA